jgi:YVTN family beta-propeller protein
MVAVTEFRILGPLVVRENGDALDVGGGKQRALLALLLLHARETVSTDAVIDALWGERPPASAASSLHAYVSRLRRALGRDRLVRSGHGYRLEVGPDELDFDRFQRLLEEGRERLAQADARGAADTLRAALALWSGPPLADLAYEAFAADEIRRLEELRLQALEERIDADLELGRHRQLVPELETLVREDPLRERLRGQLMLALYRSGRQVEALQVYRQGRAGLVRDLGLEPSQELQQLERAILTHDPALGPPARAPTVLRPRGRRRTIAAAAVGALLVATGIAVFIVTRHDSTPARAVVRPNSVAVIDAETNRIVADIPVDRDPVGIAYRGGDVWIANTDSSTISRIDPRTHAVERFGIGVRPTDVVVTGSGAIWTGNGSKGTLTEFSPAFGSVVGPSVSLRGPNRLLPNAVNALEYGGNSLWAATSGGDVVRIDPRTRRRTRIRLGTAPLAIAYGEGAVWVVTESNNLVRIDPKTNKPTAQRSVGFTFGNALATRAGDVWVGTTPEFGASGRSAVYRLAAVTMELESRIPVPDPVAIAIGPQAVWVASHAATVYRIDPATNTIAQTIRVGHGLGGIAVVDDTVWVSVDKRA